jgi:creatinine amidohydrolase
LTAHAGIGETSDGLYLFPNLVDMSKAGKNEVTLPDHLERLCRKSSPGIALPPEYFLPKP